MRLRTQLSLAGLALLVLPWAGCQYARELESVLRQGQANAVLATARAVAAALSTRADLLDPQPVAERAEDVYAHRLASDGIQVDGYVGDWEPLKPWVQREQSVRGLAGYLAATDGRALYLMIDVDDAAIHYRKPGTDVPYDHLLLSARGHDQ